MSQARLFFGAMGGVCLVHCIALLLDEGFPAGGVSFWAALCSFIIAAKQDTPS